MEKVNAVALLMVFSTIAFLLEVVYNKKTIYWRNWYDL